MRKKKIRRERTQGDVQIQFCPHQYKNTAALLPGAAALPVHDCLHGHEIRGRIRMQNDKSEGQRPSPLSRVNRSLAHLPCSTSPCLDKQQDECEKHDLDAHRASSMGCTRRCRDRRMPVHTAVLHRL